MSDTTTETPTEKKKKFALPKEARLMMVSFLESRSIDADAMEDENILKVYNEETIKSNERATRLEVTQEMKSLNMYASANAKVNIGKELIARLFKLNVPSIYLHLFRDDDIQLNDRDLWRIVNKSGISAVQESAKLGKMKRSPVKPKVI